MSIFLLKFSACLAIFMLFYKVFLERSSIHHFKRFYLLGSIIFAIIIPFLTITEYVEPISIAEFAVVESLPEIDASETLLEESPIDYISVILGSIYGLGVIIFLLKFSRNLNSIITRIKRHPKLKSGRIINVLITQPIAPHTFFNYIFLNKHKFEKHDIPNEVILHEQTHANQMHSIDVFLLEVLQIIMWFNPLIYFLKKDIKLNHEFLADTAVINKGIQPSAYQELLLTFSIHASEPSLANAINYSSIKKRFTVMKTRTSKTSILLRSLLLLPLLAILFYSFSERVQVEKEITPTISINDTTQPISSEHSNKELVNLSTNSEIELFINDKGEFIYKNAIISVKDLASIYEFENDMNISIKTSLSVSKEVTSSVTRRIQEFLRKQGIKTFSVCISAENLNLQEGATAEQISKYNSWAKKINNAIKKAEDKKSTYDSYPIVKKKDVDFYKHIYKDLMTEKQRINAEPWPNFPPPPPPPPVVPGNEVKTGFIEISDQLLYYVTIREQTAYYNSKGFEVSKEGKTISKDQVNASDIVPGQYITKVYAGHKIFAEFKDNKPNKKDGVIDSPPPPPPAPKTTLDFAIDLAKKNAKFHFENKEITSDKAIALLKENPNLNMLAKNTTTKQPLVYISEKPIAANKTQKSDELVQLNGKRPTNGLLVLRAIDFNNLKLSLKDAKVVSFKFKIRGKPTQAIKGNTLNDISKSYIRNMSKGDSVQFFDIKDSNGFVHPPVAVQVSGKLVGVKGE